MYSPSDRSDEEGDGKWCPLCNEWKQVKPIGDEEATFREALIYCPDCGAKLQDSK
jgi:hypothetical protein